MYGINLDESMGGNEFEYLIADNYDPAKEVPDGFTTRTIPAHTWAVFPCTGRMPCLLYTSACKHHSHYWDRHGPVQPENSWQAR